MPALVIGHSSFAISLPPASPGAHMIGNDLLALLCCPETRQPLIAAPTELIAQLEARRAAGTLINRAGKPLPEPITEGLLRADGVAFFPMSDGIPLLTPDDAVLLPPR